MNIGAIIAQRVQLENKIRELGGKVPEKWPWDDGRSPSVRNLQLLEVVEELQELRNAEQMSDWKEEKR